MSCILCYAGAALFVIVHVMQWNSEHLNRKHSKLKLFDVGTYDTGGIEQKNSPPYNTVQYETLPHTAIQCCTTPCNAMLPCEAILAKTYQKRKCTFLTDTIEHNINYVKIKPVRAQPCRNRSVAALQMATNLSGSAANLAAIQRHRAQVSPSGLRNTRSLTAGKRKAGTVMRQSIFSASCCSTATSSLVEAWGKVTRMASAG